VETTVKVLGPLVRVIFSGTETLRMSGFPQSRYYVAVASVDETPSCARGGVKVLN